MGEGNNTGVYVWWAHKGTVRLPERLVVRPEGEWYNIYAAKHETLHTAVLLGSIQVRAVQTVPNLQELWHMLACVMFDTYVKDKYGWDAAVDKEMRPRGPKPRVKTEAPV